MAAAVTRCEVALAPERHTVAAVPDGETLRLEDGSELRLAAAMAPRAPPAGAAAAAPEDGGASWPHEAAARDALAALALGRSVALAANGSTRDRYGRRHGQAFVVGAGAGVSGPAPLWLQGAMVEAGHARAVPPPGGTPCLDALFAAERTARDQGRGLWSADAYRPKPAVRVGALSALAGTFQIVEGRVARASRSKERIHLDFGRDWRWDFSVSVPASVAARHPAWATGLLGLAGRRVTVRGWLSLRAGPMIEIEHPGQIEIAE